VRANDSGRGGQCLRIPSTGELARMLVRKESADETILSDAPPLPGM
jgi:hypothetical protein